MEFSVLTVIILSEDRSFKCINIIIVKNINLIVSAYPNPTTDFLTLKVENFSFDALSYQLYDSKGSLLENNKLKETETSIIMSKFVPNTYFLKVTQEKKEIKTFKIIKK